MNKQNIKNAYVTITYGLYGPITIDVHYYEGFIYPGISYVAEDGEISTLCWKTDKQLSLKVLTKVVRIWNELRHEVC